MSFDVTGFISTIIDKVVPDKAQRDEIKLKTKELEQAGEFREVDHAFNAIIQEAKSSDPWTSRARPSFLYVMYIYILMAIPMGIVSIWKPDAIGQIAAGMKLWFDAIPGEMYALFGAGFLGYSASRSFDKKQIAKGKDPVGMMGMVKGLFK